MSDILVVEDDADVGAMLEIALAMEGLSSEVLGDGGAAMARLDQRPPRLVILDLMMPGVPGFEILRALRGREDWADVPVVICSALAGDDDVWRGWSSGADYYLVKPFDLDELREVVLRLLTRTP